MGLEGFRGDLCLCLDFGTEPRAIQLPKPKASWIAAWVGSPRAPTGAGHQERMQMPGHSLGPTSGGDSCPSHQSQPGTMFLGRCR